MGPHGMESARLGVKIGILGGGQLARMLIEAGLKLGLDPLPFAASPADPAAQLVLSPVFGTWNDPVALARFFGSVEAVVFENEFVPRSALEAAWALTPEDRRPRFWPDFQAIEVLQNKLRQKQLLQELGIPSAPFQVLEEPAEVEAWVEQCARAWSGELVLKWAELGYDGKGTWIAPRHWDKDACSAALAFAREAVRSRRPLFAERKVAFRREVSQVACLSTTGEFAAWPLVHSLQEQGICREVRGPAVGLGTPEALEMQARNHAERIARRLGLTGVFAVELFETLEGTLWVNELAPRVHNTGHVTQEGARTSQFENHWRALLGMPLGDCSATAPFFGMLNWIGDRDLPAEGVPLPEVPRDAHLHWYGKSEIRKGRKIGHLNVTAASANGLEEALLRARDSERRWREGL